MTKHVETSGHPAAPSIGPGRVVRAFGYSLQGLVQTWRTEGAFRQEVLIALVVIPLACWVDVTPVERILLISSWLLVMLVELLNSSIEAVVDRISEERHPLAGHAKDAGSAAVLVALVIAGLTWATLLGPRALAALFG